VLSLTAATLVNKGVSFLEKELEKVKKAQGGVVFIDEAHQLSVERQGKQVLDYLLPLADQLNHPDYGAIVWVPINFLNPVPAHVEVFKIFS